MQKPELYAKSAGQTEMNKVALNKCWHAIRWSNEPESIADVGIGDGVVTKRVIMPNITNEFKEYIGMDAAKSMLDFSKKTIQHPNYGTVQLNICMEDIPQEYKNRFDKVFACLLLHMTNTKVEQAVRNLYHLVKPGGQLIYTCFAKIPMDEAFEKLDKSKWSKFQHSKVFSPFSKSKNPYEDYRKLTKETGFEEDFIEQLEDQKLYMATKEIKSGLFESVNMLLNEIPKEEYNDYLRDYLRTLDESTIFEINDKTGETWVHLKLIVGVLTKPVNSTN